MKSLIDSLKEQKAWCKSRYTPEIYAMGREDGLQWAIDAIQCEMAEPHNDMVERVAKAIRSTEPDFDQDGWHHEMGAARAAIATMGTSEVSASTGETVGSATRKDAEAEAPTNQTLIGQLRAAGHYSLEEEFDSGFEQMRAEAIDIVKNHRCSEITVNELYDKIHDAMKDLCSPSRIIEIVRPYLKREYSHQEFFRHLVDVVWNDVTESEEVPATPHADDLITKAKSSYIGGQKP